MMMEEEKIKKNVDAVFSDDDRHYVLLLPAEQDSGRR